MFAEPTENGEFVNVDVGTASEAGDGFLLETYDAFGAFPASFDNAYVFRREPQRNVWSSTSLASPSLGVQSFSGTSFEPRRSCVGRGERQSRRGGGRGRPARHEPPRPSGRPLHDAARRRALFSSKENGGKETVIVGSDREPEAGHVVLESTEHEGVCPGAEKVKAGSVLCEWAAGHEAGALTLVNARTSEEGAPPVPLSTCGAVLGRGAGVNAGAGPAHGAVSRDGSRVLFTAPDPEAENDGPGCWNGSN